MTEVILVVAFVVVCLAAVGVLWYAVKSISSSNMNWLTIVKEIIFEFSQKQRELEEFAFIEAKERRVYVGLAEKKVQNMYQQATPADFAPMPSEEMVPPHMAPGQAVEGFMDAADLDLGVDGGSRRRREPTGDVNG